MQQNTASMYGSSVGMVKGVDLCNKIACQKRLIDGAIYYNLSTKANYCPECAMLINELAPGLCKLQPPKMLDLLGHEVIVRSLEKKIKDLHPKDGLHSPRDIKLVSKINKLSSYLDEIKNNTGVTNDSNNTLKV